MTIELTLFNKNNTKELYTQVNTILEKAEYREELGIANDIKRETSLVALAKMNKGNYFDICVITEIYSLNNIKMTSERRDFFHTLHCVNWGDMGEDLRTFVNALIFKDLERIINV